MRLHGRSRLTSRVRRPVSRSRGKGFATLAIYLMDGFRSESVRIRVKGRVVYRKRSVTTNPSMGLADYAAVRVRRGTTRVEIEVSSRRLRWTLILPITRTTRLGVSVFEGGGFLVRKQHAAFVAR